MEEFTPLQPHCKNPHPALVVAILRWGPLKEVSATVWLRGGKWQWERLPPRTVYRVPPTANAPEPSEVGSATSVLQGPPGARHLPRKRRPSCSGSPPSLPSPARHCASRVGGLHRMFWNMSQALLTPPAGRGTGALGSQPPSWRFLCYGQGGGTRTRHLAVQSPDPS